MADLATPAPVVERQAGTRRLARGGMMMGGSNVVKIAVQLVTLPVIARLLGPSEYGLFGLAMPAVMLMLVIADSGLGTSLAREREDNVAVWSSAFWFLLASGIVLALGLSGLSIVVAHLAHQPRLPPIMAALSLCLILLTLAVPGNARLTRQGRLGVNSIGEALGNIVGAAVAIAMAWRGAGTWSLVAQTLLTYGIRTGFIIAAAPFRPAWHFSLRDLHPHLAMGGAIMGTRLADTGGRTGETTLISRLIGTGFVGAYSFANTAPRFICESVSNPLWSLLYAHALSAEDDAASLRLYGLALRLFGLAVFPVVALIAGAARPLVHILLGDRWLPAVLLFQVILITLALNVAGGLGGALLYAKGRSFIQLRIMVESVALRLGCAALVPWIGVTGMTLGFGLANIYVCGRGLLAVSRFFKISAAPYARQLAGPAAASAAAGLTCWAAANHLPHGIVYAAAEIALGLTVYVLILIPMERGRLLDDFRLIRKLATSR